MSSEQSNTIHTSLDFVDGKVRIDPLAELRAERDYYKAALEMVAQHDWQQIAAKGNRYTIEAVAELIDTARRALGRTDRPGEE